MSEKKERISSIGKEIIHDLQRNACSWYMLILGGIVLSAASRQDPVNWAMMCFGIAIMLMGYAFRIMFRIMDLTEKVEEVQSYLERLGELKDEREEKRNG